MSFRAPLLALLVAASVAAAACSGGGGGGSSTPTPTPSPSPITLQNDGFPGSPAQFGGGFAPGEGGAAILGPYTQPSKLDSVSFIFGGISSAGTITLGVYDDNGTDVPGTSLYSGSHAVTGSDTVLQVVDLAAMNITIPANQAIRVAVLLDQGGLPSIGIDSDGLTANRNYVFATSTWTRSDTAGIPDDWIIRAEITPQ